MKDESKKALEGKMTVNNIIYRVWVHTIISNLVSDFGNYMTKINFTDNTQPDFVVIWFYDPKNNSFYLSMRGHDNSPNLATIAEHFGGGGHPKASGFRLNNMKLQDIIKL